MNPTFFARFVVASFVTLTGTAARAPARLAASAWRRR